MNPTPEFWECLGLAIMFTPVFASLVAIFWLGTRHD